MLFTGAGFSSSARDRQGRTVPTSDEITRELWSLCFPDEPQDESSLTDLFQHASRRCPDKLEQLLAQRLCVCAPSLPKFYERWLSAPWRRAWTLNVDDLESAAEKAFPLPRRMRPINALTTDWDPALLEGPQLPFIHLNGSMHDGVRGVTFSTTQYGNRLAQDDAWYEQFVHDLIHYPFVIVGTRLEEAPFWRHLQLSYGPDADLHVEALHAYIVTPKLTRARRALLQDLGIEWIPMSAENFAQEVLDPPSEAATGSHA